MSKITFRADDEFVEELEALEISKSEAMREALREYLGSGGPGRETEAAIDDVIRERVDELFAEQWGRPSDGHAHARSRPQDVNVTITLEGEQFRTATTDVEPERSEPSDAHPPEQAHRSEQDPTSCGQCGEPVDDGHVFCPNCGEKASRRLFCECGDEIRSDWAFCPSCGRRTPSADVLDPNPPRDRQS